MTLDDFGDAAGSSPRGELSWCRSVGASNERVRAVVCPRPEEAEVALPLLLWVKLGFLSFRIFDELIEPIDR